MKMDKMNKEKEWKWKQMQANKLMNNKNVSEQTNQTKVNERMKAIANKKQWTKEKNDTKKERSNK